MKKFLIASAAFLTAVVALFITLGCIKPKTTLQYDDPAKVIVYAKSSVALQNGIGDREFSPSSKTYKNVLEKTQEMFKVSMFDHAAHANNINPVVELDIEKEYAKYTSSMLSSKYAVLLTFDEEQVQVVTDKGDPKTIRFKKIIMLIDPDKGYQEIPIYFSSTAETGTDYNESAMVVNVNPSSLIEYINEIK